MFHVSHPKRDELYALSPQARRLLAATRRHIGNFMSLSRAQANVARGLARKGLGVYHRDDDGMSFKLTDDGKLIADKLGS